MKRILITGITGAIGFALTQQLLSAYPDYKIRALLRSIDKGKGLFPNVDIEWQQGDLLNPSDVDKACLDVSDIFHTAGLPEQWLFDASIFHDVNVKGTENLLTAALKHRVEKIVYTSTIDVFHGKKGEFYDESVIDSQPKASSYERSKQLADQLVVKAQAKGIEAIFIHPSAVYGPGVASSSGINKIFFDLKAKKLPALIKGGLPVVFVDDVARGHVLAWEKGLPGQRFILNENYYSMAGIASLIDKLMQRKKSTIKELPNFLASLLASGGEALSSISKKPPLLAKGALEFLRWGAYPDAGFAKSSLGWTAISLEKGLQRLFAVD